MSLRIAYLTGEYPRATDTFIQREVAALRDHGLEVHTCSIRRTDTAHHVGEEQRQEAARSFHVLAAARNPIRLVSSHLQWLTRHPSRYIKALLLALRCSPGGVRALLYQLIYFAEAGVLARHLRRLEADHLHNHIAKSSCSVAMLASALSGIPYSFTLHGPDIFFEPIRWRLDEKIKRAAFVACISDFCRSQAMAFAPAEAWEKLHIVHCGVDPARYAPSQLRAPRAREVQLIFVGRLAAVKGLPVLLDALEHIAPPGPALTVVGDGPDRAALEARVAASPALAGRVAFLGYRSQSEVAALLAEADGFVLPSFAEGLPVVLMEALAAEVPVIATRIAGIPELVQHGATGHLVPPGNVAALTQAIETLLNHPETAAAMARTGRGLVETEFDSASEAARLSHLFAAYAGGARPAPAPPIRPAPAPPVRPPVQPEPTP